MAPHNNDSEPVVIGLWGKPTTTWDWCESNYEVTFYVAEFWNTVTNLLMIATAVWGMFEVHSKGFEKRFHMCYGSLLIVGIGSWLFHMTLRYEMQLLDELPMMWGACIVMYCLYCVRTPPQQENFKLAVTLAIACTLYTVIYLIWPQPIIHFTFYGIMVISMLFMDLNLTYIQYSDTCLKFYIFGSFLHVLAFILWNIDNVFCSNIEWFRSNLPVFLTPLFQLHGWWHILAGYATYMHILFCIHHRQVYLNEKNTFVTARWIGLSVTNKQTNGDDKKSK